MWKKLAFSVIVFVAFFGLIEIAARFIEPPSQTIGKNLPSGQGWQAEFFSSLFDWHEPDPDLLWRFKANLDNPLIKTNSLHLIGEEISVRKPSNTLRILVLGDSSPVGLGLKSRLETFSERLKDLLILQAPTEKNIEVINAAVSGYTSEQIVRYLDLSGWALQPDIIVLYCGNNDASVSGRYSDRQLLKKQHFKTLRRILSHLAIYRVLRSSYSTVVSKEHADSPLTVRVTPEQFEENLRSIAQGCREHNCRLIVVKPPVPLLWPAGLQYKVFTHLKAPHEPGRYLLPDAMRRILGRKIRYCLSDEIFKRLYGEGDKYTTAVYRSAFCDSLSPAEAVGYYTQALQTQPNSPLLLNNLGVSYWESGKYNQAKRFLRDARHQFCASFGCERDYSHTAAGAVFLFNLGMVYLTEHQSDFAPVLDTGTVAYRYLDSALQADYFSLRIKRPYLHAIEQLAEQPNVVIVDMPRIFRENGGERLFIDHCHPTAKGHLLIAQKLYETIRKKFYMLF